LLDPQKLLASAKRLYGAMMETLWGEFLPVPAEQLSVFQPDETVEVGGLHIRAIDTPGHAEHHLAYVCDGVCFSGDIGGVRLPGSNHLRLPMPPPEFQLEKWRISVQRLKQELKQEKLDWIAPTHFGLFDDPSRHLAALEQSLDDTEAWLSKVMPADPPLEALSDLFLEWMRACSLDDGLDERTMEAYELVNPSWMSPMGMQRYWKKHRQAD
jgi:glyoxylase-like metal-dependent hydrolase (beta-lactamase superfamily II)